MVTMRKMPHKSSIWKETRTMRWQMMPKVINFHTNLLTLKNFFASWLSCKFYHIFWETTLYKAVAGLKKDLSFPPDFPLLGMIHRLRQQRRVRDPIHLLWENHGFLRSHLRESRKWPRIWPVIFISNFLEFTILTHCIDCFTEEKGDTGWNKSNRPVQRSQRLDHQFCSTLPNYHENE